MVKLEQGRYVIGFDNGYQFGKTVQHVFENGVHMLGTVEPSVKEHSLKYHRKYYKVGEGRAAITEDKVSDETARLLTMAAIAMELRSEGVQKAEGSLQVQYGKQIPEEKICFQRRMRLPFGKCYGNWCIIWNWSWRNGNIIWNIRSRL